MKRIGVRELRQHASTYLRLVKAGESVEITERGEPIAMLTPVPRNESTVERLRRLGVITGPDEPGDPLDVEPLPADPSLPTLTEVLMEMRDEDER